jgi:hypothetical protein
MAGVGLLRRPLPALLLLLLRRLILVRLLPPPPPLLLLLQVPQHPGDRGAA